MSEGAAIRCRKYMVRKYKNSSSSSSRRSKDEKESESFFTAPVWGIFLFPQPPGNYTRRLGGSQDMRECVGAMQGFHENYRKAQTVQVVGKMRCMSCGTGPVTHRVSWRDFQVVGERRVNSGTVCISPPMIPSLFLLLLHKRTPGSPFQSQQTICASRVAAAVSRATMR